MRTETGLALLLGIGALAAGCDLFGSKAGECTPTGCSAQLCDDVPQTTTCAYECEYGCLQFATCKRQDDDVCGWTIDDQASYDDCVADCDATGGSTETTPAG